MVKVGQKTAVLVVSSHVARGSVGNRAAVFALETLGHPVWAVPTVIMPWHPGHGPSTRISHEPTAFSDFMNDIKSAPWIDEVGAVLTGYMANEYQVKTVAEVVSHLKKRRRDLFHVCDPVMGDIGGLYVSQDTALAIRDHLIPICDLVTPNRFELAWLLGLSTSTSHEECLRQVGKLKVPAALVTSCPGMTDNQTGNVYSENQDAWAAWHQVIGDPPNGPGDLTAAVFLAHRLNGVSPEENLKLTTASVFEILKQSTKRGSNELTLESDSKSLHAPKTSVKVESLSGLKH